MGDIDSVLSEDRDYRTKRHVDALFDVMDRRSEEQETDDFRTRDRRYAVKDSDPLSFSAEGKPKDPYHPIYETRGSSFSHSEADVGLYSQKFDPLGTTLPSAHNSTEYGHNNLEALEYQTKMGIPGRAGPFDHARPVTAEKIDNDYWEVSQEGFARPQYAGKVDTLLPERNPQRYGTHTKEYWNDKAPFLRPTRSPTLL
jgi:hypothetical protein